MNLVKYVALNSVRFKERRRFSKVYRYFLENNAISKEFFSDIDLKFAEAEIKKAKSLDVKIVTMEDKDYPFLLKEISDPPLVLYVKGDLSSSGKYLISIVGSRKCTKYGQTVAQKFAASFARFGIIVVSGLALGIDSAAHSGAITAGGKTFAVIGSGLDRIYPASNKFLAEKIYSDYGAVISEFPFGTEPKPFNFPFRNRIISGLSYATIVVEAAKKSGSLITARLAAEQGRDVFAVPGNITSKMSEGTNMLIKDGAIPITEPNDVLTYVSVFKGLFVEEAKSKKFSADEEKVISVLDNSMETLMGISEKTGISEQKLISLLTYMEVKGLIKRNGGRYFKV